MIRMLMYLYDAIARLQSLLSLGATSILTSELVRIATGMARAPKRASTKAIEHPVDVRQLLLSAKSQGDTLQLRQILEDVVVPAKTVGEQVNALDDYKLRLKAMKEPPAEDAVTEASLLLLRLAFDPRAAVLKKAAHRVLSQLQALVAPERRCHVQARAAHALVQEMLVAAPSFLLRGDAVFVLVGALQGVGAYEPTRKAVDQRALTTFLRLVVEVLESAGERADLVDEALKAAMELLTGWRAEGRRGALVGDDAARQLAERLIVALSHVLCWGGSQQDLCSHAAQALASTLAEAWPDAHSNSGKAWHVCASGFPSWPCQRGHFSLPPPLHLLPPLVERFGGEAHLSVARSLMVVVEMDVLTSPLAGADGTTTTLFGGPILGVIMERFSSEAPAVRLVAFSTLDTWLSRALDWCSRGRAQGSEEAARLMLGMFGRTLPALANQIFWHWEHTNRKVLVVIPSAFERLVLLLEALEAGGTGLDQSKGGLTLRGLASIIAQQDATRRSHFAGLKTLLTRLGSKTVLELCPPGLLDSLVQHVAASNRTAPAAGRLLLSFVEVRRKEQGPEEARRLWVGPVAAALLSNEHTFRMRVAEYLLESLLGADPLALPELAAEVRRRAGGREGAAGLWALLVITEKGRAKGWGGGTGLVGLLHEEGGEGQGRAVVGLGEVRAAALSAEHELRMAALRVLVTSHRSTETLRPQEQALMTEVLPVLLKAPTSAHRHALLRALRPWCMRYAEALRVCSSSSSGGGGKGSRRGKVNAKGAVDGAMQQAPPPELGQVEAAVAGVCGAVVQGLYPGAGLSRDVAAVEALQLILSHLRTPATTPAALAPVYTPQVVLGLLGLFLASWERTRKLAFDVLSSFPAPLPGLDSAESLGGAVRWAVNLVGAPRRGESEAGALMMRLLFSKYVVGLGRGIDLAAGLVESGGTSEGDRDSDTTADSPAGFLLRLVDVSRQRVAAFDSALGAWNSAEGEAEPEVTLVHGWVQAARFVMEEGVRGGVGKGEGWGRAMGALFGLLEDSMDVALKVVGTRELGEEPNGEEDGDAWKVEGPVVDCRGHLVGADGESDDEEDGPGSSRQRLVVGGWLMAKETGACLAALVRAALGGVEVTGRGSLEEVAAAAGRTLLLALRRMKHLGALKCIAEAFQAVCAALLSDQDQRAALQALPAGWLEDTLVRLRTPGQQAFVLRRSAWLAYSCLAIVSAEGGGERRAVLLPRLMGELLRHARPGAADWRARVHALNVLRLLLLERAASTEVTHRYLKQAMEAALGGFRDARWAVRNSSLMVFGAIVSTVVGSAKNELGVGGASTHNHDFFKRHPDFLELLVAEFAAATPAMPPRDREALRGVLESLGGGHDAEEEIGHGDPDAAQGAPPSLFALLLLLSRLRPGVQVAEEDTDADRALRRCVGHAVRCSCLPDGLLRTTSARALAALVAPPAAPAVLATLVEALPPTPAAAHRPSHNVLHGLLLLCTTLLRVLVVHQAEARGDEEGEGEGEGEGGELGGVASLLLGPRGWLSGPGMQCPPVRQEALQALALLRRLCGGARAAELACAIEGSVGDVVSLLDGCHGDLPAVPGLASLAAWVVAWLSAERPSEASVAWLAHPLPEVRREALRALLRAEGRGDCAYLDSPDADQFEGLAEAPRPLAQALRERARALLQDQALREASPIVRRGLLSALCAVVPSTAAREGGDADLWPLLLALTGQVDVDEGSGVAASCLELMGVVLGRRVRGGQAEREAQWARLVSSAARPEASPLMRRAALASISASGIIEGLRPSEGSAAGLAAVEASWALLALTHDDEESIRDAASKALHASLLSPTLAPDTPSLALPRASEAALRLMASSGNPSAFVRGAVKVVLEGCEGLEEALRAHTTGPRAAASASEEGNFKAVIFKPEPCNVFIEPCVVASQATRRALQCMALECMASGQDTTLLDDKAVEQLTCAVQSLSSLLPSASERSAWIGGVAWDPAVLPSLVCAVLAALLLCTSSGSGVRHAKEAAGALTACVQQGHWPQPEVLVWGEGALRAAVGATEGESADGKAMRVAQAVGWQGLEGLAPFAVPSM